MKAYCPTCEQVVPLIHGMYATHHPATAKNIRDYCQNGGHKPTEKDLNHDRD